MFAVLVLGTAFIGGFMPHTAFLATVTALLLGQVAFDISMAPLVVDHHHEALQEQHALFAARPASAPPAAARKRFDLDDVVRKGTPDELRRDLYFHFMQGSWGRVLGYFLALFVVSNGVFAALYLVDPGGVSGTSGSDFFEAFAFSVQTMSTIGYGTMAPVSDWAHSVSIVEAIFGLLGAAVSTGLVFAKASLPRNSVLFSDVMVITTFQGRPTLMLRVGNARASEIIEASIHLTAMVDEVSSEGHRLRKLYDLPLLRSTTPVFAVTWTVMHTIDEDSPLFGATADDVGDRVFSFIATLTGHDATYAQATHARKLYFPEDLRFGHRFVDVVETLPDGRIAVDYERFHDTVDDRSAPGTPHAPGSP
ncbi:MAG: ATP-sensitive inward rectifier potassium channel 10 [Deltaproteobacteria bacterium]|nr:MAG: ATP-sensitive inward rectifier potassium channel 10 [Deltaproteobacteria bacterium]